MVMSTPSCKPVRTCHAVSSYVVSCVWREHTMRRAMAEGGFQVGSAEDGGKKRSFSLICYYLDTSVRLLSPYSGRRLFVSGELDRVLWFGCKGSYNLHTRLDLRSPRLAAALPPHPGTSVHTS